MKNRAYLIITAFTIGLMAFPYHVVAADLSGCVKEEIHDLKKAGFTWDEIKLHCQPGYVGNENKLSGSILGAWIWRANCSVGNFVDKFEITSVSGNSFSGMLHHGSLHNKIHGTLVGNRVTLYRTLTQRGKTRQQTWKGIFDTKTDEISGGKLTDPSHPPCTWSASK